MSLKGEILKADSLSIGYHHQGTQQNIVLEDIQVSARKGELVAVLGRNGCGKSTLLRTIAGLQKPLKGKITLFEKRINDYAVSDFAQIVSFVSTENVRNINMTVFDLVSLGRSPYTGWMGRLADEDRDIVSAAIVNVGMGKLKNKNITELSDGERQRAMIARTLAQDTDIIILDEPTAFLDLPNRYEIVHLLHSLCKNKDRTIIYSSHDLSISLSESDKIWLFAGDQVYQGAPEDMVMQGKMACAYDSSKLAFDLISGEFHRNDPSKKAVFISSSHRELQTWTYRLLKRMGYHKSDERHAGLKIICEPHSNGYLWKITAGNKEIAIEGEFYRLADFIQSLAQQTY